jgi:hypothetical protein
MIDTYSIKIVPKEFLEVSYKLYPQLKKDISLRKLFCHMVNQMITNKNKYAILNARLLAHIENKIPQYQSRNYVASTLLSKFDKHITKITYTTNLFGDTYNYTKGEARRGVINIPQVLIDLYLDKKDERVYVESNRKFSKDSSVAKQKMREEQLGIVNKYEPLNQPQKELLDYLNNLPSNRFSKCLEYIPEAKIKAEELTNERAKRRATKLLEQIELTPQPFYKPSERGCTQRVFGDSYLHLNKELRNIVCSDWMEIDIEQAQLRILARIWEIPEVTEYLDSKKSLWKDLIQYVQNIYPVQFSSLDKSELKVLLKRFIYSSCFGMSLTKLKKTFKKDCEELLGNTYNMSIVKKNKNGKDIKLSLGEYLICHKVIRPLLVARKKVMKKIKMNKGASSPYGWITLKGSVISVMANVAQSVEQLLMMPIVNTCKQTEVVRNNKTTSEIQIMGYIHDGAYLKVRKQSEWKRWIKHMYQQWGKMCKQLGMNIDLSIRIGTEEYSLNISKDKNANTPPIKHKGQSADISSDILDIQEVHSLEGQMDISLLEHSLS